MESPLLKCLNSVGSLQSDYLKLEDLELGKEYLIDEAKMIKTRYGEKVVVSLVDTGKVFLPDRFNKIMTDEYLTFIKQCTLIYRGKKDIGKANPAHQIEFSPH